MSNLFSSTAIDNFIVLLKQYLQGAIEQRIEKELGPMRAEILKKAQTIYEEEVAKFTIHFFELVHIDRLEKELRITIHKESNDQKT